MVLDKIPGPTIFTQRDVRETPAATATATSVGLTNPTYVTLSTDSDLNNERVLTAGEGMNLSDGGAGSTITVSGENASDTNKGIAKFQLSDFSVSTGDVSLKAVVVMSVDGDTGTATPALNNLDILGGTGISTAGGANDITITSTHASDDGSSHSNVVSNTSASHAESHNIASHSDTTATGAELNTLTGGGDTTLHDHDGISENTTHRSSDGSDHSLLANITSGTYTPTITNIVNLDTSTATVCHFMRVGNTVTVGGKTAIVISSNSTRTRWRINLPIASTFSNIGECGGTAGDKDETQVIAIYADTTNNEAIFDYVAGSETGSRDKFFTFTYRII